jgi:hypothetical protein
MVKLASIHNFKFEISNLKFLSASYQRQDRQPTAYHLQPPRASPRVHIPQEIEITRR